MKRVLLSLFVLSLMPAFASASDRYRGHDSPRYRYDRGSSHHHQYSDRHYYSGGRSSYGFSFGYSSGYYPRTYYPRTYVYERPYYYAPPVVVRPPVVVAPPVVVDPYCYPQTHYYGGYRSYYPRSSFGFGFYYGR